MLTNALDDFRVVEDEERERDDVRIDEDGAHEESSRRIFRHVVEGAGG